MVAYAGVAGGASDFGTAVALPSGSVGDRMVLIAYTEASTMTTPSGWTLEAFTPFTGGRRYVYSRVRQSGDVSATLPTVVGVGSRSGYVIVSASGIPDVVDSVFGQFDTATWSLSESWHRASPRFAVAFVESEDSTDEFSVNGGDFVVEASHANGTQNIIRLLVADESVNPIDIDVSGGWDASGNAAWIVVFFSDEEEPPSVGGWRIGRIHWPTTTPSQPYSTISWHNEGGATVIDEISPNDLDLDFTNTPGVPFFTGIEAGRTYRLDSTATGAAAAFVSGYAQGGDSPDFSHTFVDGAGTTDMPGDLAFVIVRMSADNAGPSEAFGALTITDIGT